MNYLKSKRHQVDYCNICGKKEQLTWDHVPPKTTGNNSETIINRFSEGLPKENNYQKKYQSGIKYRTICKACNNDLLGYYDMEYKEFIDNINKNLLSNSDMQENIKIPIKINKVCRAICGHFLAAKDFYDSESIIDTRLREYVMNAEIVGKDIAKLYYWIYPYNTVAIVRDVVTRGLTNKVHFPNNCISIINSYPLAIILDDEADEQCLLPNLMESTSGNIEDTIEILLDINDSYYPNTNQLRHYLWPCNISNSWDSAALVIGGESMKEDSRVGIKLK